MSLLAQQLIAENKAQHARGEDASYLDLGTNAKLTELPDLSELEWLNLETLEQRIAEVPQKLCEANV